MATEARLWVLLPDAPPALRPEVLTQIARAQGLQRRFAAAHALLSQDPWLARLKELATPRPHS